MHPSARRHRAIWAQLGAVLLVFAALATVVAPAGTHADIVEHAFGCDGGKDTGGNGTDGKGGKFNEASKCAADPSGKPAFQEVATAASDIARPLFWISLGLLPLVGAAGALMMSVGHRGGLALIGSAVAGPLLMITMQGVAA